MLIAAVVGAPIKAAADSPTSPPPPGSDVPELDRDEIPTEVALIPESPWVEQAPTTMNAIPGAESMVEIGIRDVATTPQP